MGAMTAPPPAGQPGPMTGGAMQAMPQRRYPRPSEDDVWMSGMREQAGLHRPYTAPGAAATTLEPQDEAAFRQWVATNGVPFNLNDPIADYDMRGYWRDIAAQGGNQTAVNPNDHQMHFPDTYKTQYHRSFSAESRNATSQAPRWNARDQLVRPDGKVTFDERAR